MFERHVNDALDALITAFAREVHNIPSMRSELSNCFDPRDAMFQTYSFWQIKGTLTHNQCHRAEKPALVKTVTAINARDHRLLQFLVS